MDEVEAKANGAVRQALLIVYDEGPVAGSEKVDKKGGTTDLPPLQLVVPTCKGGSVCPGTIEGAKDDPEAPGSDETLGKGEGEASTAIADRTAV